MDIEVLRKKISTFKGKGGRVRITDDQLYMEILACWEQWQGTTKEFYRSVGVSKSGMAAIIGKAKRMRREGHFPADNFNEIKVQGTTEPNTCAGMISLKWKDDKIINFSQVDQLVDFLKKVS